MAAVRGSVHRRIPRCGRPIFRSVPYGSVGNVTHVVATSAFGNQDRCGQHRDIEVASQQPVPGSAGILLSCTHWTTRACILLSQLNDGCSVWERRRMHSGHQGTEVAAFITDLRTGAEGMLQCLRSDLEPRTEVPDDGRPIFRQPVKTHAIHCRPVPGLPELSMHRWTAHSRPDSGCSVWNLPPEFRVPEGDGIRVRAVEFKSATIGNPEADTGGLTGPRACLQCNGRLDAS